MDRFKTAFATAEDWAHAVKACTDQLLPVPDGVNFGFVYVTDTLAEDFQSVLTYLRQRTRVEHWVGTVGLGICAGDQEVFDRPAVAAMLARFPEDGFRVFPSLSRGAEQFTDDMRAWVGRTAPNFGIVHVDPECAEFESVVGGIAAATSTFLVGGLTSSRAATHQIADRVTGGGVSGVLLAPEVTVATGLTQGCQPIGVSHIISDGLDDIVIGLDGRPALEVLKEDIGPEMAANLKAIGGHVHAAIPIRGSDTGDYLVRSLVGIDPARGWLAIAGQVEPGERILFVRRDPATAEADLDAMLERLVARIDRPPKGGLYVSCIARGANMFGDAGAEMAMIRRRLGDLPLIGFYANGEISHSRVYAYTGIMTLFL